MNRHVLVDPTRVRGQLAATTLWALCLILLIPRSAFADLETICEPRPFSGAVKRVVLSEAVADFDSGSALRALQIRYVTDFTSDGRTSTEAETFVEDPPLTSWPEVSPQFDNTMGAAGW